MTETMLTFWRELLAPFPDDLLSVVKKAGGKELTYVDKRALSNRLDSVCGPQGWDVEFRETERGYTCRIGIECPHADGSWKWNYKEDGGGEEGMTKKVGNETVEDTDNDEKSAYTNGFRRAAQDAWGIGRYLYRKGIPAFLDPNAGVTAVEPPAKTERATPHDRATQPRRFDLGYIPEAGNAVYPWIMEVAKYYHESLWPGVKADADKLKYPLVASQWTHDQVQTLASNMIRYIRTLKQYRGEFNDIALTAAPAVPVPIAEAAESPELVADKQKLGRTVKHLVEKKLGKPGNPGDIIAVIGALAADSANGDGNTGETLKSLKDCKDHAWVKNILKRAEDVLAKLMASDVSGAVEGEDDIPF